MVDLLRKIRAMEAVHKQSMTSKTLTDLTVLRKQQCSLAMDRAKSTLAK